MERSRRALLRALGLFVLFASLSVTVSTLGCRPAARSGPARVADPAADDRPSQRPESEPLATDLEMPVDGEIMPPVLVDLDGPGRQDTEGDRSPEHELVAELQAATDPSADPPAGHAAEGGGEPPHYSTWSTPAVTLVVTGQQNGYLEPCGCTGLDRQKGGVARRFTLLRQLRELGWELLPIDVGNQVRRYGRQAEIKYHRSLEALRAMDYVAVGFGPDDVRLSVGDLIQEAAAESQDEAVYLSANVVLYEPDLMPRFKSIEAGGMKIAITSLLHPDSLKAKLGEEIQVSQPVEAARNVMEEIRGTDPDFVVLMFFGDEETAQELVREVPGIDLLVVSGGDGEPLYRPREIAGSMSRSETPTRMIVTGNKGMYVGLVGIDPEGKLQYARVPLTHEFEDAPEMRRLMADYQRQLQEVGLEGLGLRPIQHPSGEKFVGSQVCGECHTDAYDIWLGTPHALATDHIVKPPRERGDVARHFDPECLSCHVTGWHPQNYQPYESGYLSLQSGSHLTGNGCENCHGPGASHVAAERGDSDLSEDRIAELRLSMRLPLERAREQCLQCHDIDNSPDFHDPDAFEDIYWPQVEHYGLD